MCGYLSNFTFSALLAMCPGRVLAAETRAGLLEKGATNGDIDVRGDAVLIKDKVHASMFNQIVHHTHAHAVHSRCE